MMTQSKVEIAKEDEEKMMMELWNELRRNAGDLGELNGALDDDGNDEEGRAMDGLFEVEDEGFVPDVAAALAGGPL